MIGPSKSTKREGGDQGLTRTTVAEHVGYDTATAVPSGSAPKTMNYTQLDPDIVIEN